MLRIDTQGVIHLGHGILVLPFHESEFGQFEPGFGAIDREYPCLGELGLRVSQVSLGIIQVT